MHGKAGSPTMVRKRRRTTLYFKEINHNVATLVFATPRMAESHDRLVKALENCKTWGEFRSGIPASAFNEIKQRLRENGGYTAAEIREITADDQAFHSGVIPGVEDAEYPSMIAGEQWAILPKTIVEKYGEDWGEFNCNNICCIDPRHRDAILAELEAAGYKVVERKDLHFF